MTSSNFKIGILVSGRGTNLQAIIDAIENGELKARIAVVLSNKKEAPALARAQKKGIEAVSLNPKQFAGKKEFDRALAKELEDRKIDLVCLAGYMRILGPEFIQKFEGKIINIHPSLLPAFPGWTFNKKRSIMESSFQDARFTSSTKKSMAAPSSCRPSCPSTSLMMRKPWRNVF